MTTRRTRLDGEHHEELAEEVLLSRDVLARHRAQVASSLRRGRARRRFLPTIVAATAVIATLGFADRFVQASVPSTSAAPAIPIGASSSSATAQALAQVARTLAADQRALGALVRAQSRLAAAAPSTGGHAVTAAQLPGLPAVPAIPVISTTAPAVSGTTGASHVVP